MELIADLNIYADVWLAVLRYLAPALAAILLTRCGIALLTFKASPEVWGWFILEDDGRVPVHHWENVIGRNRRSDIVLEDDSVSKSHCVLTRYDDGSWTLSEIDPKLTVLVNRKKAPIHVLRTGDTVKVGEVEMVFEAISRKQEKVLTSRRPKASGFFAGIVNLILLTILQGAILLGFLLGGKEEPQPYIYGFAGLACLQWALFALYLCFRKPAFEVESLAFLLCTFGMAAICTVAPQESVKQLLAISLGLVAFLTIGWAMRDLERAKVLRYVAAILGLGFLVITLLFGKEYYGAKNWLQIGSFSFQPSELTKICFVWMGASSLDRLLNKRNLIFFIAYTIILCGCLALMNDFGAALIFFVAFLLIAYMRSGSVGTVALACTALGFAGVIGVKLAPHALRRFATWRHIWEDPFGAGYQQTRALICIASGGLLGVGAGQGRMKHIFAADSDMVFATVSEEWGIVIAVLCVLCIVVLALFALRTSAISRSSFYAIAASTAAGILLVQTVLNVLGTVDVLPLTGVTFPFLSNGGSSMICVWGLLAFVKAADTRRSASFAVKPIRFRRDEEC